MFAETFHNPPRYVSRDGSPCGFWVVCDFGNIVVGSGVLPECYGEADMYTAGQASAYVRVGRCASPLTPPTPVRFSLIAHPTPH